MTMPTTSVKISDLSSLPAPTAIDVLPISSAGVTYKTTPGALSTDWKDIAVTPTIVSTDGQRQTVVLYTGIDLTGVIPVGAKLRVPRTGTTPTQAMQFVSASSQYASKSSPTGITFTDDFTCEAWVYLDSYVAAGTIISRRSGTNGFQFKLDSTGRLIIGGYNAGVGREGSSYQSVELARWTHVSASIDMSGNTAAIYMDGILVASSMTNVGAGSNTIAQLGDLIIGNYTAGAEYFNGKIANARIWAAIRTAAEIRDNMGKEVPASTTNLVAHFKGNGNFNDSSSNSNNLTASGGAVATYVGHPYSSTEYAIFTKLVYSGGNTTATLFTGPRVIPNETLGATSYSTVRTPFGFPAEKNKWGVNAVFYVSMNLNAGSALWQNATGAVLSVPIGLSDLSVKHAPYIWRSSGSPSSIASALSTTTNDTGTIQGSSDIQYVSVNSDVIITHEVTDIPFNATSLTPVYAIGQSPSASNLAWHHSSGAQSRIRAQCPYL